MLNTIAAIVAIVSVVLTLGYVAYLGLLQAAARKRGAAGQPVLQDVRKKLPIAAGTVAGALLGWAITGGDGFADVLGIVVAGGAAGVAGSALASTRDKYRSGL